MPRAHALNHQTGAQSLALYEQEGVVCADLTLGVQNESTRRKYSKKKQQLAQSNEAVK